MKRKGEDGPVESSIEATAVASNEDETDPADAEPTLVKPTSSVGTSGPRDEVRGRNGREPVEDESLPAKQREFGA